MSPIGIAKRPLPASALLKLAAVVFPIVVIDQVTKWLSLRYLEIGKDYHLIGNFLRLRLTHNSGAAFSFLSSHTWIFTVFAVAVLIAVGYAATRTESRAWQISLGMLAGGALGNLIDRLFQPPAWGQGHVVDFISYGNSFVGNVADIFIVVAAGLMVFLAWRGGSGSPEDGGRD